MRCLVLLALIAGCSKSAPPNPAPAGGCPTSPGMPGPAFEVVQGADGTYRATFTGTLVAADDAADQVTVESASGRTVAFGAYGAPLDLAGYSRGEQVTVELDASYSDHTHEPLAIARSSGCPAGIAAYGFVLHEGVVGDFDLGFRGKNIGMGGRELNLQRMDSAAPGGIFRLTTHTREAHVVPDAVQVGSEYTAYFKPEGGLNIVYALVDADGTLHRPAIPSDTGQPW